MSERVRAKRLPAELIAAVSSQQGSDDETLKLIGSIVKELV